MAELKPIKAAVIGCGVISEIYLKNLCEFFKIVDVVGCSDLIPERSKKRAEQFGIRQMTNDEIFADSEIEIVVNLTYPLSHYEVTKAALLAGKHVYSEKMIAVELAEGEELLRLARSKNLQFTVAPDTCLGGGIQTARWIVDSGMIGEPILVSGFCPRSYQLVREDAEVRMVHLPGGGIPFDMGGYYLHAFVNLFGAISRVSGFAQIRNPHRSYLNPRSPLYGDDFEETCINTMSASLQFESGVLGSLLVTSECTADAVQKIEVLGTEGMLSIHDPNNFGGPIRVKRSGNSEELVIPYTHAFFETDRRGLGVADMAYAIKNHRRPRLDASLGLHAFEVIHRVWESTKTGKTYEIVNQTEHPQAMPRTPFGGTCAEHVLDL
ncbi:MAG: Gfo/Idh/MocA family oxidoreductase [Acutalibacter sp.]|nr:Gfo/Idh/MocA family oxidoreductase [Acutalibacter sp.]